ncbi:hypothetical protein B296_00017642 [Ensete ventricosum]|uniref:Uncharacterized protein n=1 Tax=Ensete ventricosum TaxID=4639 RepID=A0A427AC86_ENSVE|nr:hypothetical protein B296_00017642 [Ensete ventricosum]
MQWELAKRLVGSSSKFSGGLLGVRWEIAEGNRDLARKASRVRQKMTKRLTRSSLEVVRKIAGTDGNPSKGADGY